MIETIAERLKWGLVFEDMGPEVAQASREGLIQPEDFPEFAEIVIFAEVERWRKGQPGDYVRTWVIGFARDAYPIVLASVSRPQWYWANKVVHLLEIYKANRVVACEERVALCLRLAGVPHVWTLADYLGGPHVGIAVGNTEEGPTKTVESVCGRCGYARSAVIHSPRHPGRHDFRPRL